MDWTNDFEPFLAPESAVGLDDGFEIEPDSYADPADDLLGGLVAGMDDDGAERHVREVLGRVFGM